MAEIKNPGVKPQVAVDVEKVRYCEDDGTTKVEFIRCFRYENGVLVGTTDYETDGRTPYTVADPANVSECVVPAAADVEQKFLCDRQATGESTEFIRHTVYDTDGTVASEYDTTIDSTVAYTVVGTVGPCDQKCTRSAVYNEVYDVTDVAPIAIDPSITTPYSQAVCAKIQVIGGPVNFTVNPDGVPDGDLTGDYAGCRVDDCGVIEIGCCGENGSIEELTDFRVVAHPGTTAKITVLYYAEDV